MKKRLMPETKTLRYMVHGMGMVAAQASRRVRKFSFDLFGFIDVVGFKPILNGSRQKSGCPTCDGWGEIGTTEYVACPTCADGARRPAGPREIASWLCVQATSSSNQAARKKKILDSKLLRARAFALINSGHEVEVWGWVTGRHAGAEAVHRFELRGTSPAGLVWHDKGITEVDGELLTQVNR